jgi:glycosyltransferase involved in cell wall biosynthesis/peptidoglycan/xylan/chitin deacetylase (PgdA/CDA1 family)
MIVHLFNSSSVSGPEKLVLPALSSARDHFVVVNLREERIQSLRESDPLEKYSHSLQLNYGDIRVCRQWDTVAVRDLRALLNRLDPDLVHAHDVKASIYLLQAQPDSTKRRYRIVSTHHGVHGRPNLKTRIYEWLYRMYFLKSFDRIFSVSSADYEDLLRSGISKERLRLHLNGVDGHPVDITLRPKESSHIRALWLPDEKKRDELFLMGVVGRLSAEKDHNRMLNILSCLDRMRCSQEWKCLIFGTGPLEAELKHQVARRGLEQRIQWMGYRTDISKELAGLDLVLSMSRAEGLPINLIEAGWAGTPVLCTSVGGNVDLIPDDSYGSRIEPKEPVVNSALRIKESISPPGQVKLRKQAARLQQRVMTEFSQSHWMQQLKDLYSEVGVSFSGSSEKQESSEPRTDGNDGTFGERVQTSFLSRLLMYPTERLEDVRGWSRNGFRILMYHRFPSSEPDIQDALARQCEHLTQYYHVVSISDIAKSLREGTDLPPNALAVTVDDGYRDFLCNGHPVFRAYRIPVTVFLSTSFIDGGFWMWWDQIRYIFEKTQRESLDVVLFTNQPPIVFPLKTMEQRRQSIATFTETMKHIKDSDRVKWVRSLPELLDVQLPSIPPGPLAPMEWSEIRYLADNGVDFGAHTCTHPILSRMNETDLAKEIVDSKWKIEDQLQKPVHHFSYPNGHSNDVNKQTLKVLEECRFESAVTAEGGVNFQGAHPYWLKRIGVYPMMSKFNFEVLLAGLGGSRSKQTPSYLIRT